MNVIATLVLLLSPDAAFEADGLRIEGSLVQGPVLQVREVGGHMMLVSGAVVEATGGELYVSVALDRVLVLERGIRATRQENGVLLSAHGKRSFILGDHGVAGPTLVTITAEGWRMAETSIKGTELRAALPRKGAVTQEDPAQDPEPSTGHSRRGTQEDAGGRWKGTGRDGASDPGKPTVRYCRVITGDATLVGKGVDTDTIKTLGTVSTVSP